MIPGADFPHLLADDASFADDAIAFDVAPSDLLDGFSFLGGNRVIRVFIVVAFVTPILKIS